MNDSLYYGHSYTKDMVSDDMIPNIPTVNNNTLTDSANNKIIAIQPKLESTLNISSLQSGKLYSKLMITRKILYNSTNYIISFQMCNFFFYNRLLWK